MILRAARDEDRSQIARLHAQSWQDSYRGILPEALLDQRIEGLMAERWRDEAIGEHDAVLVAEQDGEVIGFGAAWHGESGFIDNLHVDARWRSHGIGRALLAAIARRFLDDGLSSAHLYVVTANHGARLLYEKLGGEPDGAETHDFFGTPVENERIVWRDLSVLAHRAAAWRKMTI